LAFFFPDLNNANAASSASSSAASSGPAPAQVEEKKAEPVKQREPEKKKPPPIQRTLAIIRPSTFANHKDTILKRIEQAGFQIAFHKTVRFEQESAEEFYAEQKDEPFFDDLVAEMTSGPMLVLCLVKENAIQAWRDMLGPKEKEKVKEAPGT
jgi:nucleoside diphosphate kinase